MYFTTRIQNAKSVKNAAMVSTWDPVLVLRDGRE